MIEFKDVPITAGFKITINKKIEILNLLKERIQQNIATRIITLNPEMLIASEKNNLFKQALLSADVLIPDGIGIIALLRKKKTFNVQRLPGIELAWDILSLAESEKWSVALIGSTEDVLTKTIQNINKDINKLNLTYTRDGFFQDKEHDEIMNILLKTQTKVLLLAMPFEKQEVFLHKLQLKGFKGISIGVGGSFDVWAGIVNRAPKIFQNLGLEWLWRVINQPVRASRICKILIPFLKIYMKE